LFSVRKTRRTNPAHQ